ncbi:putative replication protein B (plasmid) [Beijerinckiaceae bacterium RH AL1]|nr:plasmid partitioning protein RepB [Beijerinckiaceae bacterium]VVB50186.1 putative replication protein B [Beijerinckiaceae bacterium RH CH11]VVB50195.1 putative replication protein B [Beijerinckiaceae bacterium RH AL8]VVC57265.1 putative replication protein B [Beijerinckiaceae bacterium RH AL1]
MRKNLLQNVLDTPHRPVPQTAHKGASRSMIHSIEEMAEDARRMSDGEAVVSLDTQLIDQSFVSDRIAQNDEDYTRLRDAIEAHGQSTPILVRPHPDKRERYMIVYGHRRTRVAAELGRPVRAVVKHLEEISHIVAQGQENSARANLAFIEKAMFAKKLLKMGQTKETAKAALSIDDTLLSRMLSVAETVPPQVIDAIGAAKGVGRDRWEQLKKLVAIPEKAQLAVEAVGSDQFAAAPEPERFNFLLARVKAGRKAPRRKPPAPSTSHWSPPDKAVEATLRRSGKTFSLSLTSKHAGDFGEYLSANLPSFYEAFQRHRENG